MWRGRSPSHCRSSIHHPFRSHSAARAPYESTAPISLFSSLFYTLALALSKREKGRAEKEWLEKFIFIFWICVFWGSLFRPFAMSVLGRLLHNITVNEIIKQIDFDNNRAGKCRELFVVDEKTTFTQAVNVSFANHLFCFLQSVFFFVCVSSPFSFYSGYTITPMWFLFLLSVLSAKLRGIWGFSTWGISSFFLFNATSHFAEIWSLVWYLFMKMTMKMKKSQFLTQNSNPRQSLLIFTPQKVRIHFSSLPFSLFSRNGTKERLHSTLSKFFIIWAC
jgi:hypothetical protein